MNPAKKKASARTSVKFRDLKGKKDPKGGSFSFGVGKVAPAINDGTIAGKFLKY